MSSSAAEYCARWERRMHRDAEWRARNAWNTVHKGGSQDHTDRLKIDGGWLYRTRLWSKNNGASVALTFVPDKEAAK